MAALPNIFSIPANGYVNTLCWKDRNVSRSLGNIQKGMLIVIMVIILISLSGCGPSWKVIRTYDGPKKSVEEIAIVFALKPIIVTAIDNKPAGLYDRWLLEWHLLPGKHSITAYYYCVTDFKESYNWEGSGYTTSYLYGELMTKSANFQKGFVYQLGSDTVFKDNSPVSWRLLLEKRGTIKEVANSPAPIYDGPGIGYPYPPTLWEGAPRHWRDFRAAQHPKSVNSTHEHNTFYWRW